MAAKRQKADRLAKNFHRTFIPERQYLGELLKYAADGGAYEIRKIAEATGIPTGASSGKSIPTADYCRGMGLVSLAKPAAKDADTTLSLTPFGRTVFLEDKFFKEPFTQWLAHLRLCNEWRGADTWFYLFCESAPVFGNRAAVADMMKWISPLIGGKDPETAVSPTIRMYADEASFADCGAIVREKGELVRASALGSLSAWSWPDAGTARFRSRSSRSRPDSVGSRAGRNPRRRRFSSFSNGSVSPR